MATRTRRNRVAIVGLACRYPDARTPQELWENAVAGRRAFRRLPDVRMRAQDYYDPDPAAPDRFYARHAAVIEGYTFDRISYKIAGSTYRSTDLTHWLALDMAAEALADAGFPHADGLARERTCVVVGNSLTGEFTRANQLRLRWPYVQRTLAGALREHWDEPAVSDFLARFEETFKAPFPPVDEDTLAGALSNTIAGRICNHFDLRGGGYTVDGACSSSLLSVATACRALIDNEADVAIAGGVDLSIDPFEIIGFAKTGALATGEMRVYDSGSNGFWPGEGCGMVVLMREPDAVRAGHRIYASIAGWGISSDGRGGITRPEVGGYRLALRRAYDRAGFGIETIGLFEGHGTGTKVGDTTELTALSQARRDADPDAPPAAIGSIKGMIGHTKAAAGVAGLVKAALAVHHEVLPPTIGCVDPHELFGGESPALRVLRKAEPWPTSVPVRAGITAMGFGGINTHLVLETPRRRRRGTLDPAHRTLAASLQDAELLLVEAGSRDELRQRLAELAEFVSTLAYAQLADLAATLLRDLRHRPYRAAVVALSPDEARQRLRRLCEALDSGETTLLGGDGRAMLGHVVAPGRVGYLFPGQGSGRGVSGGALRRRFPEAEDVYLRAALPSGADVVATQVAQPRIVTGAAAGLRALSTVGIEATVAVGHSLGEIAALHWAGAMDARTLLKVATVRGATMAAHSASGTMAGIGAGAEVVERLIAGRPVVVAGYNGPTQTVIAGPVAEVEAACDTARAEGHSATRLAVSHAFHSPLVAPAATAFGTALADVHFSAVDRRVVSTVTAEPLPSDVDIPELLRQQIIEPVQFSQAVAVAAKDIDLFVEVGPGRVLGGLASSITEVPCVSLDTDDESLASLLRVVAAAYLVGAADNAPALVRGRPVRPLEIGAEFSFFANPCEQAPVWAGEEPVKRPARVVAAGAVPAGAPEPDAGVTESTVDLLRRLAAGRAELPLELVGAESRLLDDLHLSSITVGQVMNQLAQHMGRPAAQLPTNLATATVRELADALDTLAETAVDGAAAAASVEGAAAWVRPWSVELDAVTLAPISNPATNEPGGWQVFASPGHPLVEPLRRGLERAGLGGGILVCLPEACEESHLELALAGAHAAMSGTGGRRFVLVQHGRGAAGLAKTLRLEAPAIRTTVVQLPTTPDPSTIDRVVADVVAEVTATTGFSEAYFDEDGTRRVPTLRVLPVRAGADARTPLGPDDVLLVTGGGKGITAECALAMAVDSGARLALLGRSDPATDTELAANLARMAAQGVTARYARADVSDTDQVRRAVAELVAAIGPVTAVLHGAGRNEPAALSQVDMTAIRQTFAPKLDGLRAVLDAIDPRRLRLLVTLGSIIGRAGLRGEAHYAVANEWLAELTAEVERTYPNCRALCLEWSVWAGVGMGERLSVVESLSRDGVTPVSPDQGVAILRRLLADPATPATVVISGRTLGIDTVRYDAPELPLLRFVERPLIRYHGVELVSEVELSAGTDRYLADHELDGNLLLPAVFGLEAMAQVTQALTGRVEVPSFERVEFLRPIVVPRDDSTLIRVAAVATDDNVVEAVIRSAETGFAAEHFRARLCLDPGLDAVQSTMDTSEIEPTPAGLPAVPLEPRELYQSILFQGARFQRVRRYHRAAARDVDAELAGDPRVRWFASYLPDQLILGDPGVRDALMHGTQVGIPHATLLPAGVDRIEPAGERITAATGLRYQARERSRDGDTYVYDVVLRTDSGEIIERWHGLRLRAVRKKDGRGPWLAPLLGPYLERSLADLVGASSIDVAVAVEPDPQAASKGDHVRRRRALTAVALGRALGRPVKVRYRPDGRPEVSGPTRVSSAHGSGLTLSVGATGVVGCDVEPVQGRTASEWQQLLGAQAALAARVAEETGESLDAASTRVWSAIECLQKSGRSAHDPLALRPGAAGGWVVLTSSEIRIASLITTVHGGAEPLAFSVLFETR